MLLDNDNDITIFLPKKSVKNHIDNANRPLQHVYVTIVEFFNVKVFDLVVAKPGAFSCL